MCLEVKYFIIELQRSQSLVLKLFVKIVRKLNVIFYSTTIIDQIIWRSCNSNMYLELFLHLWVCQQSSVREFDYNFGCWEEVEIKFCWVSSFYFNFRKEFYKWKLIVYKKNRKVLRAKLLYINFNIQCKYKRINHNQERL